MYVVLHLAQLPQSEQEFTILPFYCCQCECECMCMFVCVSQVMRRGVMDRGSVKGKVRAIYFMKCINTRKSATSCRSGNNWQLPTAYSHQQQQQQQQWQQQQQVSCSQVKLVWFKAENAHGAMNMEIIQCVMVCVL